MIFDEYFQIKMNFAEDPTVTISYFKNEIEYEILKIWKNLLDHYGVSEDKFKIRKEYFSKRVENREHEFYIFTIEFQFNNTQTVTYYKSIGTFAGIICELSDKLRKEIIEKEKILKRELV